MILFMFFYNWLSVNVNKTIQCRSSDVCRLLHYSALSGLLSVSWIHFVMIDCYFYYYVFSWLYHTRTVCVFHIWLHSRNYSYSEINITVLIFFHLHAKQNQFHLRKSIRTHWYIYIRNLKWHMYALGLFCI